MTQQHAEEPDDRPARELIELGSAALGVSGGAAVTVVAGPVVGGLTGVAITRGLRLIGLEVRQWQISRRQEARIGGVVNAAAAEIERRLEAGDTPRDDGFFVENKDRSRGFELLGGVVLAAADAYEELKVPFLGRLWASLIFRPDITPEHGNTLLRLAERLSYRQLAVVALFFEMARSSELSFLDADRQVLGYPPFPDGLGLELQDLADLSLLGIEQNDGRYAPLRGTYGGGTLAEVDLGNLGLAPTGADLAELMGLADLDRASKSGVMETLKRSAE